MLAQSFNAGGPDGFGGGGSSANAGTQSFNGNWLLLWLVASNVKDLIWFSAGGFGGGLSGTVYSLKTCCHELKWANLINVVSLYTSRIFSERRSAKFWFRKMKLASPRKRSSPYLRVFDETHVRKAKRRPNSPVDLIRC